MSISTIVLAVNAMLLRRLDRRPAPVATHPVSEERVGEPTHSAHHHA